MNQQEFNELKTQSGLSDEDFTNWIKTSGLFEESLRQEILQYLGEVNA